MAHKISKLGSQALLSRASQRAFSAAQAAEMPAQEEPKEKKFGFTPSMPEGEMRMIQG